MSIPPAPQPAARPAARLDATSVRVIAQSIPGVAGASGAVRDDVARALALDTEVALRRIVSSARCFMTHGHRSVLRADDIRAALRLRGADAQAGGLGYYRRNVAGFQGVAPGLFVAPQKMLRVCDASAGDSAFGVDAEADADAEADSDAAGVEVKWMAFNGEPFPGNGSDGMRLGSPARLDRQFSVLRASLESGADEDLDTVLAELSKTCGVHASLPAVVSLFHTTVSRNMSSGGSASAISSCLRVIRALLANPHFGLEAYVGNLLPGLLTCVAGRVLGGRELSSAEDASLRGQAAEVMGNLLRACGTPVLATRSAKTLVAAMTSDESDLRVVHGAMLGLVALGRNVVEALVLPCVPGMLAGLKQLASAVAEAEKVVEDTHEHFGRELTTIQSANEDACALAEAVEGVLEVFGGRGTRHDIENLGSELLVSW